VGGLNPSANLFIFIAQANYAGRVRQHPVVSLVQGGAVNLYFWSTLLLMASCKQNLKCSRLLPLSLVILCH